MNKYIRLLDRIEFKTEDDDFSVNGYYDKETDKETFTKVAISCQYSGNDLTSPFKGIVPNLHDVICIVIDCDKNEIEYISYFDNANEDEERDSELHDKDVRQLILGSLTADELKLYHNKCRAVIDKAIEVIKKRRRDQHNKLVDRFGGKYI